MFKDVVVSHKYDILSNAIHNSCCYTCIDGQYKIGQDYFCKTSIGGGSTVVKEIITFTRALLDDVPRRGDVIDSTFYYVLMVAKQGFDTLNDLGQVSSYYSIV